MRGFDQGVSQCVPMAPGLEHPAPLFASRVCVQDVAVLENIEGSVEEACSHIFREILVAWSREQDGLIYDKSHFGDDDSSDVGCYPEHGARAILEQTVLDALVKTSKQLLAFLERLAGVPGSIEGYV